MKNPRVQQKKKNSIERENQKKIGFLPTNLFEALDALEEDHEFLLHDGVFTKGLINTWIKRKKKEEAAPVAHRPHPYEFELSFGCKVE